MIAIIGATGNVGRPLVRALVAAGEEVVAISRHAAAGEVLLAQLLVTGVSSVQHGIWQAPTMRSDSGAYRGRS